MSADKDTTKTHLADVWCKNILAADRGFKTWANRFRVDVLYSYYEGYQWDDDDQDVVPYIVNLIYANLENKLPGMMFQNPEAFLRPRPTGDTWDEGTESSICTTKQDITNYILRRREFNLGEKHELAILDAHFGFGVLHTGYSEDIEENPYIPNTKRVNSLNYIFCKQIPYDRFRVSIRANWDLSEGKWYGYFEFVPASRLDKYRDRMNIEKSREDLSEEQECEQYLGSGRISIGTGYVEERAPANMIKIYNIWNFEKMEYMKICPDNCKGANRILELEPFTDSGISTLRFGKRRRGWYPLPPVFNWMSPQDEVNEVKQSLRIHRKRFKRKYLVGSGALDPKEEEKLLYGPDGTVVTVTKIDAFKALEDAPMDQSATQALVTSYDDFNRVAGAAVEQGRIQDRTTASQAVINDNRAKVRDSKDQIRVANFLVTVVENVLSSLKQVKKPFWSQISLNNEGLLQAVQKVRTKWKQIPPGYFNEESEYDVDVKINSVSPIYREEDKKALMEFLAILTQYPQVSMSPPLMREAADKVGYRNEAVLEQLQQWAQLMAIGREQQLKGAVQATGPQGPQPTEPGTLPQRQVAQSTSPDNQEIMNAIFNRGGLQQ